mmetsp:Transcript_10468/g.15982  ORF Transcript_10468/g.15982 Transcript_10468/m.15982 type:complete len:286 (+) Transcript_10468:206-1063(+)
MWNDDNDDDDDDNHVESFFTGFDTRTSIQPHLSLKPTRVKAKSKVQAKAKTKTMVGPRFESQPALLQESPKESSMHETQIISQAYHLLVEQFGIALVRIEKKKISSSCCNQQEQQQEETDNNHHHNHPTLQQDQGADNETTTREKEKEEPVIKTYIRRCSDWDVALEMVHAVRALSCVHARLGPDNNTNNNNQYDLFDPYTKRPCFYNNNMDTKQQQQHPSMQGLKTLQHILHCMDVYCTHDVVNDETCSNNNNNDDNDNDDNVIRIGVSNRHVVVELLFGIFFH